MDPTAWSPGHWPFLRRDAERMGVPRRRLGAPAFRTVLPGVLVASSVPDTVVVRARAAVLLAPDGAVVSHWTAARLWGGRVPDHEGVHLAFMRDVRLRVRGIRPHRHRHRLEIVRWQALPLTSPAQTFCHMARVLGLVDLVALGDSLVRKGRFTPGELVDRAAAWEGQCREAATAAARLVREGVDSSPETALRLLIVLAGLPEPDVNITRWRADGSIRFRIELGFEEQKLAIEYDGRWHEDPAQRRHDDERRTSLSATEGWRFVVVTADELYGTTEDLVLRLHHEMRVRGVPVPERPSDGWRAHFRVPLAA